MSTIQVKAIHMHQISRSARFTVALGMAMAAMAGCSVSGSVGGGSVDEGELAVQAVAALEAQTGATMDPSESLTCLDDLKTDAGSVAMCEYRVASGSVFDVTVTSEGIGSDDKVAFTVVVSDTPR
ncbi:MAG: DUF4333 domain-containing protein [Actinobacteria bacterium]|nr:DUF4333 domain-containing protein [Actinomycetota bacterium]